MLVVDKVEVYILLLNCDESKELLRTRSGLLRTSCGSDGCEGALSLEEVLSRCLAGSPAAAE